jgi:hypothetical protein
VKKFGRNQDEKNSKEGSATQTFEEATGRVVRRVGLGGCVRDVADPGGVVTRDALREASISAQLRHLRKPQYGTFVVEKRQREAAKVLCGVEHGPVWEYRLSHAVRGGAISAKAPKDKGSHGAARAVC